MVTQWLPLVFSAGWASGINPYAVVLLLGLAGRFTPVEHVPQLLTDPWVLVGAAVLCAVELVADKVAYVDSLWDTIHTVIRPIIGASLGVLMVGDAHTWQQALAATTGGGTALVSHLVKAGLRLGVNTSPEPASNIIISAAEDSAVALVVALALIAPWVAAAIAAVILVGGVTLVVLLWVRIRRTFHILRQRRQARRAGV